MIYVLISHDLCEVLQSVLTEIQMPTRAKRRFILSLRVNNTGLERP